VFQWEGVAEVINVSAVLRGGRSTARMPKRPWTGARRPHGWCAGGHLLPTSP